METLGRLPDLGIGVTEFSLRNFGKAPSSSDHLKSVSRGYAIINFIRYKDFPGIPSGPTDQLPFRFFNPLKTSSKEKYITLLSKSKVRISDSLSSKCTLSIEYYNICQPRIKNIIKQNVGKSISDVSYTSSDFD